MNDVFNMAEKFTGIPYAVTVNILKSVVVLLIVFFLVKLAVNIINKYQHDVKKRYKWLRLTKRIAFVLFLFIVVNIWILNYNSLGTFLGLASAGIAIALKDLLTNLAGWLFIIWRKPFELSDRIEVDNIKGDIIDIRVFQFTVIEIENWVQADQSTGRVVHIPNSTVFKNPISNYTVGFNQIWDEIQVMVTFESDWQKAKGVLHKIVKHTAVIDKEKLRKDIKDASNRYLIYYDKITPAIYTSVLASGINFSIRYLTDVKKRRNIQHNLWEKILIEFDKYEDIDFAYPTVRYYNNKIEGKLNSTK